MIMKLVREHLPEWIEAGSILMGVFVAAIFSAGITYYKVDLMTSDVAYIKQKLEDLPTLVEKVNYLEKGQIEIKKDVKFLERNLFRGYDGEKRTDQSFSVSSK